MHRVEGRRHDSTRSPPRAELRDLPRRIVARKPSWNRIYEVASGQEGHFAELPAELELPRPAQELVQQVGKHQVFTMPVAVGLLVVVFGNRSSLGWVRLRARNVQREIEEIVAGAIPPDDGGPSGAAAAAVAWPPAGRNRGSA